MVDVEPSLFSEIKKNKFSSIAKLSEEGMILSFWNITLCDNFFILDLSSSLYKIYIFPRRFCGMGKRFSFCGEANELSKGSHFEQYNYSYFVQNILIDLFIIVTLIEYYFIHIIKTLIR